MTRIDLTTFLNFLHCNAFFFLFLLPSFSQILLSHQRHRLFKYHY